MVVPNFFYVSLVGQPDRPQGAGNREIRGFQAIMAQDGLWHLEKSWARAENGKKHNFLALGVRKLKKKVITRSRMVVRNFFTFYVLPDQTPMGGKSHNTGISGHFGLGRPLAQRNPGAGPNTEKCNFPVLGALLEKNPDDPKFSPRKCATFLLFMFWPTGPPRVRNREIRGS